MGVLPGDRRECSSRVSAGGRRRGRRRELRWHCSCILYDSRQGCGLGLMVGPPFCGSARSDDVARAWHVGRGRDVREQMASCLAPGSTEALSSHVGARPSSSFICHTSAPALALCVSTPLLLACRPSHPWPFRRGSALQRSRCYQELDRRWIYQDGDNRPLQSTTFTVHTSPRPDTLYHLHHSVSSLQTHPASLLR